MPFVSSFLQKPILKSPAYSTISICPVEDPSARAPVQTLVAFGSLWTCVWTLLTIAELPIVPQSAVPLSMEDAGRTGKL